MTAIITEAIRNPQARRQSQSKLPLRAGERFIKFVVGEVFVFIKQTFPFPDGLIPPLPRLNEGNKLLGEAPSPGFISWFLEILKISPACQDKTFATFT